MFGRGNEAQEELLDDRAPNETAQRVQQLLFGEKTPKTIAILCIAFGVALTAALYTAGMVVNIQDAVKHGENVIQVMQYPFWRHILAAVFTLRGWLYVAVVAVIVTAVLWLVSRKNTELTSIKSTDSRKVDFSEKGTYGTAEWMTEEEAKEVYEITNIDNARGVILAQYTEHGDRAICLPENTKDNRNIIILGSPGTGKSYCYVRNAAFQAIVRGESAVITDPKGELFESTAEKFRAEGYKVLVFNMVDPKRSDAWDCMSEIYDPETGDISDIRVTEFTDALMKNTSDGPTADFWGTGENNLLRAIIMFCAWRRETALKAIYEKEGKRLLAEVGDKFTDEEKQKLLSVLTGTAPHVTMNERKNALRVLALADMDTDEKAVDDYIKKIGLKAPLCNIGSMYYLLSTSDIAKLEDMFAKVPTSHPAAIAWGYFKSASDNVRPGLVQGLGQRLQLFQMRDIRRITTNDTIHFEDLGKEKTVLFCVISDKSPAMKALTSMMFTFLFKDIADAADRFGPENRLYVNVICDEFANLGVIPSFDTTISTVRSRKINISIILQSIMQLAKNYEESQQTIISCCDTILFLGCNDTETANFISELSGTASIRVLSSRDSRNTALGNRGLMQGYALSEGDGKRMLLNPDEVRRLPREDVILYHRGYNILQAHRCGYDNHRFTREGLPPKVRLREYPLASDKYALTEDLDAFLVGDATNMAKRNKEILEHNALEKSANTQNGGIKLEKLAGQDSAFEF